MNTKRMMILTLAAAAGFGSLGGAEAVGKDRLNNKEPEQTGWIEAHEWGVQECDWDKGFIVPEDFPDFIYTNQKPGIEASAPVVIPQIQRIAKKPVLYFRSSLDKVKVDVEVGFEGATPCAWYPQVTKYTPSLQLNVKKGAAGFVPPRRLSSPYQLSWDNLILSKIVAGEQNKVPRVAPGHWIHQARDVDAMLVSNTKGAAEHYLFYEGAYNRAPDVTVIPGAKGSFSVVNVTDWPLENVVVVYRDSSKGIYGYTRIGALSATSSTTMKITRGDRQVGDKFGRFLKCSSTPDKAFKTSKALRENLRDWFQESIEYNPDPGKAGSVPEMSSAQLRPDETKALLDIWQKDMFESEGITIVFRHNVNHLNKMIPLRITAPRGIKVTTRRCGLMINKNVSLKPFIEIKESIGRYCSDEATEADQKLLRDEKQRVLGMIRGELGAFDNKDASRMLHLQRLQALLNIR